MSQHVDNSITPRPIDCHTTVRRLWDYLDEELDAERFAEVEAHVADCSGCAEHFAFSRHFLSAVATSWQAAPSSDALKSAVVARLAKEGFGQG
jgi:anti-sigma factor (TIGR02949 family)